VHSQVQSLSTAKDSPELPGAAWGLLAGRQGPSTQNGETQYQFCIFCITSLIIHIISIISVSSTTFDIQFVSLPFPPFPFLWWWWWGC